MTTEQLIFVIAASIVAVGGAVWGIAGPLTTAERSAGGSHTPAASLLALAALVVQFAITTGLMQSSMWIGFAAAAILVLAAIVRAIRARRWL